MDTKLYPLKFAPVYKQIIWGGDKISRKYGRSTPFEKVAESWELTCREDGMSVVTNGPLMGRGLDSLISEYGERLLGERSLRLYGDAFPLLFKLIDANDKLSVQVHPDDVYARAHGEANGKTEMWYIIDAKQDARLVYGLKDGVTKESFEDAVQGGRIGATLRQVPVKPGDCLYIPSGTVHAILDGILLAEIQQNSNTTYRIYDWDRVGADGKPRQLHIKSALDVIDFGGVSLEVSESGRRVFGEYSIRSLAASKYFSVDEVVTNGRYSSDTRGSFVAIMNIEGNAVLSCRSGETPLAPGETLLIPACIGGFEVTGKSRMLLTHI